jgi:hypothetical protein
MGDTIQFSNYSWGRARQEETVRPIDILNKAKVFHAKSEVDFWRTIREGSEWVVQAAVEDLAHMTGHKIVEEFPPDVTHQKDGGRIYSLYCVVMSRQDFRELKDMLGDLVLRK